MSSTYGDKLKITVFGQSHSEAIGVTCEGFPSGFEIDKEKLYSFMQRRAPGKDPTSTSRAEADMPEFLSGLADGVICGAPLTAIIRNTNTKSSDYTELFDCPRPGHADFTARMKYGDSHDVRGGGYFSGRMTAPLCIAGGIALQILEKKGIYVGAHIIQIGNEYCDRFDPVNVTKDDFSLLSSFPVRTEGEEVRLRREIMAVKAEGDSVGGAVECAVVGIPAGVGDPMFDGMENRIAKIVFGVPAVKAVEFGLGMDCAKMRGSQANDPFCIKNGRVETRTNNAGGILGGITNGMPLIFRVAIKPTPSIAMEQDSVSLAGMCEKKLSVKGRHDPCIVPRAVPVIEAVTAIAVLDAMM